MLELEGEQTWLDRSSGKTIGPTGKRNKHDRLFSEFEGTDSEFGIFSEIWFFVFAMVLWIVVAAVVKRHSRSLNPKQPI